MDKKFKFYRIDYDFLEYLKSFDKNVFFPPLLENKKTPLGLVVDLFENTYFIPLISPKAKHSKMKSQKDFLKIEDGNFGAINFSNMIPVEENLVYCVDINSEEDQTYRTLLKHQLSWCNKIKNREKIVRSAQNLYCEILKQKTKSRFYKRCCNFELLEEKLVSYIKKM